MGRPQETFNKKELEKRRMQKRKEKQERKEERKAQSKDGSSLEDMLAYVDENGNISATPPDPTKKKKINQEDVQLGARNNGVAHASVTVRKGKVTFFNSSKGFGFIKDSDSGESIFVHQASLSTPIKENDTVTFETQKGPKGLNAVKVKLV